MKRRTLLKALSAGTATAFGAIWLREGGISRPADLTTATLDEKDIAPMDEEALALQTPAHETAPAPAETLARSEPIADEFIRDCEAESIDYGGTDVIVTGPTLDLLKQTSEHLARLQKQVGYTRFNLLNFDDLIRISRQYSAVGEFSRQELDFMEQVFAEDASLYGFYGEKVLTSLTDCIRQKDTTKLSGTGHYLYKGDALAMYNKVRKDVGDSVILTSGVRSIVKQMHLFLGKAVRTNGNFSEASYSLAPPGYSYHGIGDFDVGKVGFGINNFTDEFAKTDEYKRLIDLGYVLIRYTDGNPFGVRFEPWHIKVV